MEIDNLMVNQRQAAALEHAIPAADKKVRYESDFVSRATSHRTGLVAEEMASSNDRSAFVISEKRLDGNQSQAVSIKGLPYTSSAVEVQRSLKLNMDPIMELKHIIGYSPSSCLNLKWSRLAHENIVMFSSAGVLISMDVETMQQKRFFFGHSAPICCFDLA